MFYEPQHDVDLMSKEEMDIEILETIRIKEIQLADLRREMEEIRRYPINFFLMKCLEGSLMFSLYCTKKLLNNY